MNNPCNEICIGKVDDVVEWWQINSYNAGYHRGLNTEYHDVPIEELFAKWIADVRRPASAEAFDPVAFEKGYNDGREDYESWKKEEILHDRPHKEVGRARAAKVHRVPSADEMAGE